MNITILTVDTDYTRTLLNSKLEEQNHKVLGGTNNYDEAFKLYKECLPDIVILDIDLGGTGKGLSFISNLLKIDPSAQIIALSTLFENSTKASLFRQGVDRLVMKPYQPAHVWQEIDDICDKNDMDLLRKTREQNINDALLNKQDSISTQYNNQISSLREQISKSRKKEKSDFIFEMDDTNIFADEIDYEEKTNLDNLFDLDIDKTNNSDNSQYLDISLYDTSEDVFAYGKNDFTLEDNSFDFEVDIKDTDNKLKGYMGLPKVINREDNYSSSDDYSIETQTPQKSMDEDNNSLINKLLKKKGGK